jgi:protein involved in polysaccharide export with SLBB domain
MTSNSLLVQLFVALCICATHLPYAQAQQIPARAMSRPAVYLQPGDKVQLKIWREPDLSGEFVVSEAGIVVFPKVGPLNVSNLSIDSLTRSLTTRYAESLRNPAIEVTALKRINVLGAVRNPGFFYADPTVTVSGAVAMAGGVTTDGNQKRIVLLRADREMQIDVGVEHGVADSPVQSGDNVRVPERSWAARNTALIASGMTGVALIVGALIRP